jgi:hypothetical protein
LNEKSSVNLRITASQTLTADSKRKFEFSYDTSAMPTGEFSIKIGNRVNTIELKPKGAEKACCRLYCISSLWEVPLKVKFTDRSTG